MTIAEFLAEAGARADTIPAVVIELIEKLEARIVELETKLNPPVPHVA